MAAEEFDRINARELVGASEEVAEKPKSNEEGGQPKQESSGDPWADINLDDIPQFRNFKSTMDKRLANLQNETAQERRQRLELEQQLEQERLSRMSEQEAAEYRAQLLQKQFEERQRELELREAALRRQELLGDISRELDVPVEVMEEAADPVEAVRLAVKYRRKMEGNRSVAQREEEAAANKVDLGGGAPPSEADEWQKKYDKAKEDKDTSAMLDIMFEADRRGVRLRE